MLLAKIKKTSVSLACLKVGLRLNVISCHEFTQLGVKKKYRLLVYVLPASPSIEKLKARELSLSPFNVGGST